MLKYYDSKGEGPHLDPKAIQSAAQEVKYLLDWKQGKILPDQGIDSVGAPKIPEKKKRGKDIMTLQDDYFPAKPALIDRTGLLVANSEDPEEFLQMKRRGSARKQSRDKKKYYPLLDSSPEMTSVGSPTDSAKKFHHEIIDFKLVPTKLEL